MKIYLLVIVLFTSVLSFGQEFSAPPPPEIEISADKKKLVDELIKVTNFENYVTIYCTLLINQFAIQNNWDEKKKQDILNSNFKFFNRTLYYNFKDFSKENLMEIIKSFKTLNKNREPDQFYFPDNYETQIELMQFVSEVIMGKYKLE